jgi:hypothetical protein
VKKPKAPRLVTVAIFTTITIIFWVFFSLYNIFITKPPPEVDPKLLVPLDPTLDTRALTRLEGRVFFEEGTFAPPIFVNQSTDASGEIEETTSEEEIIETLEEVPAEEGEDTEVATQSGEEVPSE